MLASVAGGGGLPVNSTALVSRTSLRLVVEVLDGDPAQVAQAQAVGDDEVRPLVVDVDLDGPRVPGDEDGLADRLEVVADSVDVECLVPAGRSRNIVS